MNKYAFKIAIFDMDGVITQTARVHTASWKKAFDEFLQKRAEQTSESFQEFTVKDYLEYVDGKPRLKGIQSFLSSRGITLPPGNREDPPEAETVWGIGTKKNSMFRVLLAEQGVDVYEHTVKLIRHFRENGIKTAVVSSSKNCKFMLEQAGLLELFDTRVDGIISEDRGLHGKPESDIFTVASWELGVPPEEGIVFEDANSGVQAGKNGGFGLVVGIAREDNAENLNQNGADCVVTDLKHFDPDWANAWFRLKPVSLFGSWDDPGKVRERSKEILTFEHLILNPLYLKTPKEIFAGSSRKPVFFLDYDGTLTPIVDRPQDAKISESMQEAVKRLADKYLVAVVSGRMREDVENLLGIEGLFYAGSHGFDIAGPGMSMIEPEAEETIPVVARVTEELKAGLNSIEGVIIEEKKFSVAVHYRLAPLESLPGIRAEVEARVSENKQSLRLMEGKKVFEILPAIDWNKGKAVTWIRRALGLSSRDSNVVYIGDDTTDEYAFRVLRGRGTGILVAKDEYPSSAQFRLSSPEEVGRFFETMLKTES